MVHLISLPQRQVYLRAYAGVLEAQAYLVPCKVTCAPVRQLVPGKHKATFYEVTISDFSRYCWATPPVNEKKFN